MPASRSTFPKLVLGVNAGDMITVRGGEPGSYKQIRGRLTSINASERWQACAGSATLQMQAALVPQH